MSARRGRFEKRKQRQNGGKAAELGGLTPPSRAMTDAKGARCKCRSKGGSAAINTAFNRPLMICGGTRRCRSGVTIMNLVMAAMRYYVPVINRQEK